jgi:hypothetical protein
MLKLTWHYPGIGFNHWCNWKVLFTIQALLLRVGNHAVVNSFLVCDPALIVGVCL